jgi:hypothetical protein
MPGHSRRVLNKRSQKQLHERNQSACAFSFKPSAVAQGVSLL